MNDVTVDMVADAIFELVTETKGKKNLKPMDCVKFAIEKFGDSVDKKMGKAAIRQLVDSGRCIYSYAGGSYLTLPEG